MTVIEYLESRGFNPLQDVEKGDWEDSIHLHELIENCIEAINKNSVIHGVSNRSISEHDKIKMAGKWSRERSEGNRQQDRDCYYDFYQGMEAAEKKLNGC